MADGGRRLIAATLIGVATFGASSLATEFAWHARDSEADQNLTQIGEIYLDGLAASLEASIERGAVGDVDRRLRSAMNEQNGIAERAIIVVDEKGNIKNRMGNRALFTDPRMTLKPGAVTIDRGESTMFVARRLGNTESHVAVALNIDPLLKRYSTTRMETLLANILAALFAAGLTFWAVGWGREEAARRSDAQPAKPRLVA